MVEGKEKKKYFLHGMQIYDSSLNTEEKVDKRDLPEIQLKVGRRSVGGEVNRARHHLGLDMEVIQLVPCCELGIDSQWNVVALVNIDRIRRLMGCDERNNVVLKMPNLPRRAFIFFIVFLAKVSVNRAINCSGEIHAIDKFLLNVV